MKKRKFPHKKLLTDLLQNSRRKIRFPFDEIPSYIARCEINETLISFLFALLALEGSPHRAVTAEPYLHVRTPQ